MFEKSTHTFVGTCGGDFFDLDGTKHIEIGYRIMFAYWGKGFASKAANALVNYLLDTVKLPNIYGFALHQNTTSLKILEKVSFSYQRDFIWAWFHINDMSRKGISFE